MDKQKQRLKARRREERQKQKRADEKAIIASFRKGFEREGLNVKANDKEMLSAYNEVQRQIATEAVMLNTVALLTVMHRSYKYGAKRLHRIAGEIAVIITEVGNGRRSIDDLRDILKGDARLNIDALRIEDAPDKKALLMRSALTTLPIQLTAVFYWFFEMGSVRRKSKRLIDITAKTWWLTKRMIRNDSMDDYRRELEATGLAISPDGKFGSAKLTAEENNRLKARIMT